MKKFWIDKNIKSTKQAFIGHIGSENGFLDDGLLEFQSKSTKHYDEEMTADVFEECFQQIIECIPAESVILLGNAPYHSRLVERLPTNSWKIADILQWIRDKNFKHKEVKNGTSRVIDSIYEILDPGGHRTR